MKSRAFRVGYFGVAGEASRGEGWLSPEAGWWNSTLPSTSQLFPRGSAADSGYWALRCSRNQRFLAWVRNAVTSGRLHTTIACACLDGDQIAGFVAPLARRLQEASQAELMSMSELEVSDSVVSLSSAFPWFLALYSTGYMKLAGSVQQMLSAASCFDPLMLVAAAGIYQEYEARDANIAVMSTYPERPERGDFLAAGWNAILIPGVGGGKSPQGLAVQEVLPYSESIRRRSVEELSPDVLAIMSRWTTRATAISWQERLDIPLDLLLPHEMTREEWERRKEIIRDETDGSTFSRDLRHLLDSRHEERVLELAVIEAECGKEPNAMTYLVQARLGLSSEDLQQFVSLGRPVPL